MASSSIQKRAAASLFQEFRDRKRRESRKPILHGDRTLEFPPIEGLTGEEIKIRVHADFIRLDDYEWEPCTCCEHPAANDDDV